MSVAAQCQKKTEKTAETVCGQHERWSEMSQYKISIYGKTTWQQWSSVLEDFAFIKEDEWDLWLGAAGRQRPNPEMKANAKHLHTVKCPYFKLKLLSHGCVSVQLPEDRRWKAGLEGWVNGLSG